MDHAKERGKAFAFAAWTAGVVFTFFIALLGYWLAKLLSQYIQTLERTMGTRLLERNNKYVRLNKSGEILYHHAKEILGLYTKMQHLIDDLTNQASGPILIGASYTFGEYILPHFLTFANSRWIAQRDRSVIPIPASTTSLIS